MSARFASGDAVRVSERAREGHVRTPRYLRGKLGIVERRCGSFGNPELLAYGRDGGSVPLYRVRFRQADVWPAYRGNDADTLDVDVYEHWLEPAAGP